MAKRERLRFIEDGYNEEGYVRAQPGVFDQDFWFLFRPMTIKEQQAMAFQQAKMERKEDYEGSLRIQAKAVASKVLEWNFKRPDGKDIPVAYESLMKMKPMLFKAVCAIVCGYEGSDELNQAHMQESNDEAVLQRIMGDSPEETKESIDAKNSEAG